MKDKLLKVIEAVVIIALGVVVAVCGGGTAIDIYFGIVALVGGLALLIFNVYGVVTTKKLLFTPTFLCCALTTVGIALFTPYLTFAALINLVIMLVIGLGVALIVYGLYCILLAKKALIGVGEIIIGFAAIVLAILFITVEDFRTIFWIILGVLIIVYGVFYLVFSLIPQKSKK